MSTTTSSTETGGSRVATPRRRARKHAIDFLVGDDAAPAAKRERILCESSPVTDRAISPTPLQSTRPTPTLPGSAPLAYSTPLVQVSALATSSHVNSPATSDALRRRQTPHLPVALPTTGDAYAAIAAPRLSQPSMAPVASYTASAPNPPSLFAPRSVHSDSTYLPLPMSVAHSHANSPPISGPQTPTSVSPGPGLMDGTVVSCSECGFAGSAAAVMAHARAHHAGKPYACFVCGRCFGEKGNMNKHYRTVHLKQRRHGCQQCGRQFAFLDGLNRHISMVHLDRRPFECTHCQCPGGPHGQSVPCTHICGMRFKQKSHRRRHVRSVHQAHLTEHLTDAGSSPLRGF